MLDESDLSHIPWFTHQPAPLRAAMLVQMRRVSLAAGQTAYLEGDEDTGLWIVLNGLLRLELPVGVAFHNGDLYISAVSRIYVLRNIEQVGPTRNLSFEW